MEPSYFFFMILPLAVLVVFLVVLVIHYARKEEDDYENEVKKLRKMFFSGKLDKKTFVNQRGRLKNEKIFAVESKKLLALLSDEKIDERGIIIEKQEIMYVFDLENPRPVHALLTDENITRELTKR